MRTFFEEQLSLASVAFVPKNLGFSGDPTKKLREETEKSVFDMVKASSHSFYAIKGM